MTAMLPFSQVAAWDMEQEINAINQRLFCKRTGVLINLMRLFAAIIPRRWQFCAFLRA